MNPKAYIIDSDADLADPHPPTAEQMEAIIWQMDEKMAMADPDEYAMLREIFDYQRTHTEDLAPLQRRRLARLEAFFAAHPEPPPEPQP